MLIDEKVNRWESQLMRKLIDKKVGWWKSWLMRKLIDENVDWWKSQLKRNLIDEKVNLDSLMLKMVDFYFGSCTYVNVHMKNHVFSV